ncbi:MAG: erg24, C-14 sterol reductase [Piccolia ochrophora]|nr:MAG: erg24, C-14 sterol reductase [Piccolia ochrophora]
MKEVSFKGKSRQNLKPEHPSYEFNGPLGVTLMTTALPLVCYASLFLCNDISGCPVPSVLHPKSSTLQKLKLEVAWPTNGVFGLVNVQATAWMFAFYFVSLVFQRLLPGKEVDGVELKSGGKMRYKFNAFNSGVLCVSLAIVGTVVQGPDFALWTFIWENHVPLLTVNLIVAFALATFVYVRSFSVKAGNTEQRELAEGGQTGNLIYDWFIGRELNPRITLPFFGNIDIKTFCELRPGFLGWVLLDLAAMARQYKTHGYLSDSIVLTFLFQALYIFDGWWMEDSILTTIDVTTDGFGFMLSFGDLVWLPFIYSIQLRYLAIYPVQLGVLGILGVVAVNAAGYYVFRASNNQKNRFRNDPSDPRVSQLEYMETKTGSRLLTSGWWGLSRHPNYLGDWIMAWAWCMPTGIAGYVVQHRSPATGAPTELEIAQGDARGWGMLVTYFYVLYFAVLLIHRGWRDEAKCAKKYGAEWDEYKRRVPSRIVPGVY